MHDVFGAEVQGIGGIQAGNGLLAGLERVVKVTLIFLGENWLGNAEQHQAKFEEPIWYKELYSAI